jgi:hypothetical protein
VDTKDNEIVYIAPREGFSHGPKNLEAMVAWGIPKRIFQPGLQQIGVRAVR